MRIARLKILYLKGQSECLGQVRFSSRQVFCHPVQKLPILSLRGLKMLDLMMHAVQVVHHIGQRNMVDGEETLVFVRSCNPRRQVNGLIFNVLGHHVVQ